MKKRVVAGALGECVHVAGVLNFLNLAEQAGWETFYLGPAVPVEQFVEAARHYQADLVGVSYRLTAERGEFLLAQFAEAADDLRLAGVRFAFGGTPPVVEKALRLGFFEQVFDASNSDGDVLAYLLGQPRPAAAPQNYPQTTIERIRWKAPHPLLRHHFGLPNLPETVKGIEKIAGAGLLDVISLAIDQDAQANFYHPERQNPAARGAGGAPVRSPADFRLLYEASRRGNLPLVRTYSGSDDFIPLAEMLVDTIHQAWGAVPLFWFNQMDGRGPWDLEGSIREHQKLISWYGQHDIPVELNEPHHWGMRDAPDAVFVAAAYLSALNARAYGARDYIAQLMFNSPPGLSQVMDLAKMVAVLRLIEPLAGPDFHIWKQTRSGLLSYPIDPAQARAHMSTGVYLQMALNPHIVHIVGPSEAHHAASADEVIEACKMCQWVIENAAGGMPDLLLDPHLQARVYELVDDTRLILEAIQKFGSDSAEEPLTDAATLARAVAVGILDAPQLRNNVFARGQIKTRIFDGACVAVDSQGKPLSEADRLAGITC